MAQTSDDLQSKICRAVRALLIEDGAGSTEDTIAAPSSVLRELPITAVMTGDGQPFDGPGNWQHQVNLDLRDDAVNAPDEADTDTARIAANARCTKIVNALMLSEDGHTLDYTARRLTELGRALAVDESEGADEAMALRAAQNADMADFTVLWWEAAGQGAATISAGESSTYWQRDLQFNCVACNSAIS